MSSININRININEWYTTILIDTVLYLEIFPNGIDPKKLGSMN